MAKSETVEAEFISSAAGEQETTYLRLPRTKSLALFSVTSLVVTATNSLLKQLTQKPALQLLNHDLHLHLPYNSKKQTYKHLRKP